MDSIYYELRPHKLMTDMNMNNSGNTSMIKTNISLLSPILYKYKALFYGIVYLYRILTM